jgi:AAHS family benzoate transporter-like MFS transporter
VGRLGGVLGPIIGGWLAAAGIGGSTAFYIYGGVALLGALVTVLVPHQRKLEDAEHKVEEIAGHRTEPNTTAKQPQ